MGKGVDAAGAQLQQIITSVSAYLQPGEAGLVDEHEHAEEWLPYLQEDSSVLVYSRAECNEERVLSMAYKRPTAWVNYWVVVDYEYGVDILAYVACVKYFMKLVHPNASIPPLKMAICDMYDHPPAYPGGMGVPTLLMLGPKWKFFAVPLPEVKRKLACQFEGEYMHGVMRFMDCYAQTDINA